MLLGVDMQSLYLHFDSSSPILCVFACFGLVLCFECCCFFVFFVSKVVPQGKKGKGERGRGTKKGRRARGGGERQGEGERESNTH